jgi:hypothetical protein
LIEGHDGTKDEGEVHMIPKLSIIHVKAQFLRKVHAIKRVQGVVALVYIRFVVVVVALVLDEVVHFTILIALTVLLSSA